MHTYRINMRFTDTATRRFFNACYQIEGLNFDDAIWLCGRQAEKDHPSLSHCVARIYRAE